MSKVLRSTSPTGRYAIYVDPWEPRMSLWIETPQIVDTSTGCEVIEFKNPHWSLESASWQTDSLVRLKLRKYPGDHFPLYFDASVDCEKQCGTVAAAEVSSLAEFEATLEKLYASGRR